MPPFVTTIRQTQHRLSPSEAGALVSAYQAGRSVAALSRDFKINKSTVQAHLVRANVPLRPQKVLTADQAVEVVALYLAGQTLKQLGPKFGVGHNTVRNYLLRAGVELRAAKRRTLSGNERQQRPQPLAAGQSDIV
jgi:DNA-directed RNA polymerase specialized sigma24 family protein